MENEGHMAIPILGYIIALISPLIGLIYGAALFYFKKDVSLLSKTWKIYNLFCNCSVCREFYHKAIYLNGGNE
ncbi:hypothetical protein [uncultured Methanobrevibacter sp.]|uniref:hypothetical protein n=1 Tax=uncultured Methanobrevibacter sp. TaxID=253161 RepID=UPI0025D5AC99|nr:hypothetical protein [uncultured Methanobrevibacter sp.]